MRLTQTHLIAGGIVLVALLIITSQTLYVVDQTQQALVLRLGEPVRVVNSPSNPGPGLKVKIPFAEERIVFERKSIALEPPAEEVLASNQERLVVDSFLRYQIVDPLQFYRAVRDERSASDRLQRLVSSSLRQALGAATTEQIIATDRSQIMQRVRDDVDRRVEESRFGVEIVDLRIKRADLPDENATAVFERMSSQRRQEAAEIRARGAQQAQEIVADATRQAETTRGEGAAERARIFADSFGRDPSFAQFYRTMRAYEESMAQGNTTLVLSPDSDFFTYFENGPGG
jgi:membrane protease subunit HflC